MPYKSNLTDIEVVPIVIATIIGIWGSIVNYQKRHTVGFSIFRKIVTFAVDTLASIGLSIFTFMLAQGYGLNELVSIGVAGVFAHQGTRGLYLIELIVTEKVGAMKTYESIQKDKK